MISDLAVVQTEVGSRITVHEFAVIRPNVRLGNDVVIHPHVVIESDVELGDGVEIFPGAYLGKLPRGAGALARPPKFTRGVVIGRGCSIGPNAVIFQDVRIGEDTLIGDGASVREQCRIGANCIISRYVTVNYDTVIGDRTKVMDLTHVTGNCVIGSDVFVSVMVGMTNDNLAGRGGYEEERVLGPTIEDRAIVGAGATLFPGVHIGAGAVVGAGSVVTRDVAPGTTVMGVPARAIDRRT